jgi:hypothetical protein
MRQHTSAYVSIRQHTSSNAVSLYQVFAGEGAAGALNSAFIAPAYVSIRQHTSAYVSIRQHTSAYVSIRHEGAAGALHSALMEP